MVAQQATCIQRHTSLSHSQSSPSPERKVFSSQKEKRRKQDLRERVSKTRAKSFCRDESAAETETMRYLRGMSEPDVFQGSQRNHACGKLSLCQEGFCVPK
jgi:hypothetical protein